MNAEKVIKNLFHVLGNPNRLKLFDLLMTGVHCNCELSDLTGLANNLTSHNLKVLEDAQLIQSVRSTSDGRWIYYSINKTKMIVVGNNLIITKIAGLAYKEGVITVLIGSSGHFEIAIAAAVSMYGVGSLAALGTTMGLFWEVPIMLGLVEFAKFLNRKNFWRAPIPEMANT